MLDKKARILALLEVCENGEAEQHMLCALVGMHKQPVLFRRLLDRLEEQGYITKDKYGMIQLVRFSSGLRYREERRLSNRYWITTAIAVLALVMSFIALFK